MFKNFGKKVFRCPQCTQKLRVPIRPGKNLRVTCQKCHAQFEISFKSPLLELFQWEKGRTFKYNLEGFKLRFRAMPIDQKMSAFLTLAIVIVFLNLVFLGVASLIDSQKIKQEPLLPKDNSHYEVI